MLLFFVVPTLVRRLSLEGPDSQVFIRILRSIPYGSAGCNSFQILINALMERDSPERRLARTRCNCWTPDALVMIFRSIPRGNLKLPLPRSMFSRKLSESASIAYYLDNIFGPTGLIFKEAGPRESPCGTPDGRLGLPRNPEISLGRGGGGVGEDFQRILGSTPNTLLLHFPMKTTFIEILIFLRCFDTKASRFWGGGGATPPQCCI